MVTWKNSNLNIFSQYQVFKMQSLFFIGYMQNKFLLSSVVDRLPDTKKKHLVGILVWGKYSLQFIKISGISLPGIDIAFNYPTETI